MHDAMIHFGLGLYWQNFTKFDFVSDYVPCTFLAGICFSSTQWAPDVLLLVSVFRPDVAKTARIRSWRCANTLMLFAVSNIDFVYKAEMIQLSDWICWHNFHNGEPNVTVWVIKNKNLGEYLLKGFAEWIIVRADIKCYSLCGWDAEMSCVVDFWTSNLLNCAWRLRYIYLLLLNFQDQGAYLAFCQFLSQRLRTPRSKFWRYVYLRCHS